jgi:hypothetical protein
LATAWGISGFLSIFLFSRNFLARPENKMRLILRLQCGSSVYFSPSNHRGITRNRFRSAAEIFLSSSQRKTPPARSFVGERKGEVGC